jgi:5-deoxy-glucuronate isomerase
MTSPPRLRRPRGWADDARVESGGTSAHLRAGETAGDGFALVVTPERAGWAFAGLRVLELEPGGARALDTGPDELVVLPLAGGCAATVDGEAFALEGRAGVFAAVTDCLYVPRDTRLEIASEAGGRFALPSARAARRREPRHVAAAEVPVELRGAGRASRQVNAFCGPDADVADRLIAVEVLTPAGNWSSYPPHKHDEDRPGVETALEELYWFEVAPGPNGAPGFAFQRVYGSGPGREIDVCAEVRSGDVVVMPHGYHGPSMAAPGYDLYYLNVMAGAGERAWRFTDDPAHAWVRSAWEGEELDPRLPMTTAPSRLGDRK